MPQFWIDQLRTSFLWRVPRTEKASVQPVLRLVANAEATEGKRMKHKASTQEAGDVDTKHLSIAGQPRAMRRCPYCNHLMVDREFDSYCTVCGYRYCSHVMIDRKFYSYCAVCDYRQCSSKQFMKLLGTILGGALVSVLFVYCMEARANFAGRVEAVTDGDTLTVLTTDSEQVQVRLAEIDAPEKAQPFGSRSKQSLSELAYGKEVRIHGGTKDRYGRVVGRVFVGKVDVCVEQIRRGLAWYYRQYSKGTALLELEAKAKATQRGLWADKEPVPPWKWRRGKRLITSSTSRNNPKSAALKILCSTHNE